MPTRPQPPAPPDISGPGKRAYRTDLTAEQRRTNARLAARARWAAEPDRLAVTQPGRDAARARYYQAADEAGITDPVLREKMARSAEQAHMTRLRKLQLDRAAEMAAAARGGEAA